MLNIKERHHVLVFFRYFTIAGAFPLHVDVDSWEIQPGPKSSWKTLASRITFGIFLAHTLYKNWSLASALVSGRDIPLYQMVIHLILAGAAAMLSYWYYVLHIQYSGTYAAFVRTTLTATVTGSKCYRNQHKLV